MNKSKTFGEIVEGYSIPVLNEREIRASAGILFVLIYTSLMLIIFNNNFMMIKYVITLFLIDFIIRVLINPKYSPTLIIGRMVVHRQNPEYVGAAQKKLAWIIGLVLAIVMFILMPILNTYSVITGLICLVCLIFLFFESAFGICLGCLFYGWFYKEKAQYCPGEVCDIKAKQDIQKISLAQIGMVVGFIVVLVIVGYLFNDHFRKMPTNLWEMFRSASH
jgi:hypothetical protein